MEAATSLLPRIASGAREERLHARIAELERELRGEQALAKGYMESLDALRNVLTAPEWANRDLVPLDSVLGFTTRAHDWALKRANHAYRK